MIGGHIAVEPLIAAQPPHWSVARFKAVLDRLQDRNEDLSEPMMSLKSSGEVVPRESLGQRQEPDPASLPRYLLIQVGDLVVNPMWLVGGAIGVSEVGGAVSPDYRVFSPRAHHPRYLHYLLRTAPYIDQYRLYTRAQTTFDRRVQQHDLDNLPLLVPPPHTQAAIADFLDRETARIDTLVAKQELLIATLRERRRALIEQRVFRGLSETPTCDNDEVWLPATPTHWPVLQLGHVSDTLAGWAFPSEGFTADTGDTRLLRGVNIKPGRTDWSEVVYWDRESAPVPSEFELDVGDLVLGMDRPFVSDGVRIAGIAAEDLPALLLQRVMRMRPIAEADRDYLRYVVTTRAFLAYLEPLFSGVSVPHISEWQVRKFKLPVPPLDEQRAIAAYLGERTAKIDTLIARTERFIELAKERRSALITAAVTGQIDVRESA